MKKPLQFYQNKETELIVLFDSGFEVHIGTHYELEPEKILRGNFYVFRPGKTQLEVGDRTSNFELKTTNWISVTPNVPNQYNSRDEFEDDIILTMLQMNHE